MRVYFFFAFIFCCISLPVVAQNAYYDALFCASINPDDVKDNLPGLTEGEKVVFRECQQFLKTPFASPKPDFVRVKQILNRLKLISDETHGLESFGALQLAGLATSLIGLSKPSAGQVDTLARGLNAYFADEFKRGYLETYLKLFNRSIGRNGELQVLLPHTYEKLRTFNPARYKKLGDELKGVFDEDLTASFDNIIQHIESEDPARFQDKDFLLLNQAVCERIRTKPYFAYVKLSGDIAKSLINKVHPSEILGQLDENYAQSGATTLKPFYETVHLLNILQRNLRDTAAVKEGDFPNIWINFEKFSKLNTPKKQLYFLALLYNDNESTSMPNTYLSNILSSLSTVTLVTTSFSVSSSDKTIINNALTKIRSDIIGKLLTILIKIDEYSRLKQGRLFEETNLIPLMQLTGELIQVGLTLSIDNTNPVITASRIKQYVGIASDVFQLYDGIRRKNYSNIFLHINNVIRTVAEDYTSQDFPHSDLFLTKAISGYIKFQNAVRDKKPLDSTVNSIISSIVVDLNNSTASTTQSLSLALSGTIQDKLVQALTTFYNSTTTATSETLTNALLTSGTITLVNTTATISGTLANGLPISGTVTNATAATVASGTLISGLLIRSDPNTQWSLNSLTTLRTLAGRYLFSDPISRFTRSVDQWSGFMASVVSTTTTEQVRDVIKNYVAPPASYLDKRINTFTGSIGGLPGAFIGLEHFDVLNTTQSFAFGLTLPIGIDFSIALNAKNRLGRQKNAFSLGVFGQLFDLGAMLRYRISSGTDNITNSITLAQLFSPGGFFILGLPNSPLTLGAGYQYTPQLYSIHSDGQPDIRQNAHRFILRLSYDIPLFRLFGSRHID